MEQKAPSNKISQKREAKKKGSLHDPGRLENPGRVIVAEKDTSYTERAAREVVLFGGGGVQGSLGGGGVDDREQEVAATYEAPHTLNFLAPINYIFHFLFLFLF